MCGIFGGLSANSLDKRVIYRIAQLSSRRGQDSSGFICADMNVFKVFRFDESIQNTITKLPRGKITLCIGHSRLITHGETDNQPIEYAGVYVFHNGIVLNANSLWKDLNLKPKSEVDSEIIAALVSQGLRSGESIDDICQTILKSCIGVVSAAIFIPENGKLILVSNNGSMYLGKKQENFYFASEKSMLVKVQCDNSEQILGYRILEFAKMKVGSNIDSITQQRNLVPTLLKNSQEAKLLEYEPMDLIRCKKCILPSTMPYISFDDKGICNYCHFYVRRNEPKPLNDLQELLTPYRKTAGPNCIFPFSGGRDSSFGLHYVVKELGLKPIAYTYDWGMVTDLGRRNISRMCSALKVENIIIAADISKKRSNIRKNLLAWIEAPNLGMLSILTAGDKHFFRYVEKIKKETGIALNLWSVNPLEVTHFKAGFLGVKPDFYEKTVYRSGLSKQIRYHALRFNEMRKSTGYFNSSLIDTLSGEFYRSKRKDQNYFHLFDYKKWDEGEIENLLKEYGWEWASDTKTSWRIGDGTAAFYNYVYHRVAGFTEHDTFRSNQIREGDIKREEAIKLIAEENLPRYKNIKWYLDTLSLPFTEIIEAVNRFPRMYN